MPSFILIRPTVWPQYTNVTDTQYRQTGQRFDSIGRTFYKRSPKSDLNFPDEWRIIKDTKVVHSAVNHTLLATTNIQTVSKLPENFPENFLQITLQTVHSEYIFCDILRHYAFKLHIQKRPNFICTPLCRTFVPHCTLHFLKVGDLYPHFLWWRRPCLPPTRWLDG